MNCKLQLYFLLLFAIIGGNSVNAQGNDFELWTSIGISKKINKKFELGLKDDLRFYNNATQIKKNFTQLSCIYKPFSFISFKLAYRFITKKELNFSTSFRHLVLGNLKLNQQIDRFKISYRVQFQQKYSSVFSSETGSIPSSYLRHKWYLDYKIRGTRFSPRLAFETFQNMNIQDRFYQKKQRFTLACTHESKQKNETTLFLTFQRELNQVNPINSIIFGMKYNFSI